MRAISLNIESPSYIYIRNDAAFCTKIDISADQDEIICLKLYLPKTEPIFKTTF